jgi:dTDP-3-amino-3,4,6-trideoxy-alpha-D-glucose transaminase
VIVADGPESSERRAATGYRWHVLSNETAAASRVPFLDLGPSHAPLAPDLIEDIAGLIETSAFTNGPDVAAFEDAFASYCGTRVCVGVGSGLDALRLALAAAGVGPGDEVIVPALTFVASLEAVTQVGATPVIVDVTDDDYCLDVGAVEAATGARTRCVMPVHLYGQLCDMRSLASVAETRGLAIVEDACQAHGARREVAPGELSLAAAFSFYPGKNLGAMGDAGALVTNDEELATRVRALREHGQVAKYDHRWEGWTSRLDTIQALVLRTKLPHLDGWNDARRAVAARYLDGLAGVGDLVLPPIAAGSDPVWHLFVVRTELPDELARFLAGRRIGTGRHYPVPPHLSAAYRQLGHTAGAFPVAEAIASGCLSLPMYPGMTDEAVEHVLTSVRAYFDGA